VYRLSVCFPYVVNGRKRLDALEGLPTLDQQNFGGQERFRKVPM